MKLVNVPNKSNQSLIYTQTLQMAIEDTGRKGYHLIFNESLDLNTIGQLVHIRSNICAFDPIVFWGKLLVCEDGDRGLVDKLGKEG